MKINKLKKSLRKIKLYKNARPSRIEVKNYYNFVYIQKAHGLDRCRIFYKIHEYMNEFFHN